MKNIYDTYLRYNINIHIENIHTEFVCKVKTGPSSLNDGLLSTSRDV